MAIESTLQLKKYKYGVDDRKTHQLYGMSRKTFYNGVWVSKSTDSIIIAEIHGAITEHEAFFCRELNDHDHIIRTCGYVDNPLNSTIFFKNMHNIVI